MKYVVLPSDAEWQWQVWDAHDLTVCLSSKTFLTVEHALSDLQRVSLELPQAPLVFEPALPYDPDFAAMHYFR